MNANRLSVVLREIAIEIRMDRPTPKVAADDVAELVFVLARIVEGRCVERAFGAPGDWGYGTPIADALAAQPVPTQAEHRVAEMADAPRPQSPASGQADHGGDLSGSSPDPVPTVNSEPAVAPCGKDAGRELVGFEPHRFDTDCGEPGINPLHYEH